MAGPYARCEFCEQEYRSVATSDAGLCPKCDAIEQRAIAAAYASEWPDGAERPWSKAAMRERLGGIGDVDE